MTGKVANMSNYPNGFTGGLLLEGIPTLREHSGKVFYLGDTNSAAFPNRKGASDTNKGGFLDPLSTLDNAVEQCLAARGDVIRVLPGTQLDIEASTAIDVEGIAIVGMGFGDDRPQLALNIADALDIEASNVTIANVVFDGLDGEVASGIDVVGSDFHMVGCHKAIEAHDEGADFITVTATGHRAVFAGNTVDGENASEAWVDIEGAAVGVRFLDNYLYGGTAPTSGWIDAEGQGPTDTVLKGNDFTSGTLFGQTAAVRTLDRDTAAGASAEGMQQIVLADLPDASDELLSVTGTVDLWGAVAVVSTAASTNGTLALAASTGETIMVTSSFEDEATHAEAPGDSFTITNPGGAAVAEAVGALAAPTIMWDYPIRLSDCQIDMTAASGGNLVLDWVFFYAPVTDGAVLADIT